MLLALLSVLAACEGSDTTEEPTERSAEGSRAIEPRSAPSVDEPDPSPISPSQAEAPLAAEPTAQADPSPLPPSHDEAPPAEPTSAAEPAADAPTPRDPTAPALELLARARPMPPSSTDALFHIGAQTDPRRPSKMLVQVASRWMRLWQLDVHEGVEIRRPAQVGSDWFLTIRASRARAEALAAILGVGVAELSEEPGTRLEPRLLRVRETSGVREQPTTYNVSTAPRGTIVLGLLGQPRETLSFEPALLSTLDPGGHVFVTFGAVDGWIPAERLEPYEGCLPALGPLLSEPQRAEGYAFLPAAAGIVAEHGGAPTQLLVSVRGNYEEWVGVLDVVAIDGRACHLRPEPVIRAERDLDLCRAEVAPTEPPLLVTEWARNCFGFFDYVRETGIRTTRIYPVGGAELTLELVEPTHPALGPRRRTSLRWNARPERGAPRIPLEVRPATGAPRRYVFEGERLVEAPQPEPVEATSP